MKIYITLLMCLFSFGAHSNQRGVTDEGDVVILYDNGTWQYENDSAHNEIEIPTNPQKFSKSDKSNFVLKSKKTNSTFSINSKSWAFGKDTSTDSAKEYVFNLKGGDLYGAAITEQIEVATEELVKVAFDNARLAAPDARIIKKEYRTVNNTKVIYMEMVGTIQSVKFKYLGYYHSNSTGSTQFLVYTGSSLVSKYQTEIDEFLNGFAVQ